MKPRHIVIDRRTGEAWIQARGGKTYSLEEVAEIDRRAADGDAEAIAIVESLDATGVTREEYLHDCPECREALARGEQPVIAGPAELRQALAEIQRKLRPSTGRPMMRRRPYRPRHR